VVATAGDDTWPLAVVAVVGVTNCPPTNIGDGVGDGNGPAAGSSPSLSSSDDSGKPTNSRYDMRHT
jgi:hypothetical protein